MFLSSDIPQIVQTCLSVSDAEESDLTRTLIHGALQDLRHKGAAVQPGRGDDLVQARLTDYPQWVKGVENPDPARPLSGFSGHPRKIAMALAQIAQILKPVEVAGGTLPVPATPT